ncbi:MAG: TetR/AcrR family transcriptional regulator [Betaproteobacteria bacterium]|nr:TetR/AcrR family transcriptional regulator [Betaproteobacteria bacterium]
MQKPQADLTREKILASAFCEIHRKGFQAASLADILEATGLTKGALYYHFPTKQALGLAVVDEVVRTRLEERIFAPVRGAQQPLDMLIEVIERIARDSDAQGVELGCPLNNLMQEMSPLDPAFKERLAAILDTWHEVVRGALSRAQARGEARDDFDCDAAALFIVAAFEGCVGVAKNLQSVEAFRACMRQLAHFVVGLKADRS